VINTGAKLARWYVAVLCGVLALYTISCAPGSLWQDSGLIQYRIWHSDIEGPFGLATSHPLFYILAIGVKYLPLGEFAHRVNMVSAIAAAVAVANMFLLVRLWLGRNFPAVIAAMTLAISHTFWRHASIIETYTLWTALFLAELIVLLQYTRTKRVGYLYWLGLFNGLAIAVHMLASIPLLCYFVFIAVLLVKKNIRIRNLAVIIMLWFLGALPYEYLIITNIVRTGDVAGTLASAVFGNRWQGAVLNTSLSMRIVKENLLYVLLNFPTPNILLFFAGCIGLFKLSLKRNFRNVLLGLFILFFVFAFRYTVPDRYAFFIPFYCMVSIFVGLGTYLLLEWINNKVVISLALLFGMLPVGVYAVAPSLAKESRLDIGTRNEVPYRDDYKYFLQPWKTVYNGAGKFADEALGIVDSNAVVYADVTTVGPLLYAQEVEGKRPDVKIVSGTVNSKDSPEFNEQTIEKLMQDRSVYVVSPVIGYCPAFVLDNYELEQVDVLWRVVSRQENGE